MPRWLMPLLQLAVSIGLLGMLIVIVDWNGFRDAAAALSVGAVVTATLLCIVAHMALVLRWRTLIALIGVDESWSRSWHSVFAGLFLTNFLPGTLGSDGLRVVLLTKSCGRASTAIGAIAYERLMQLSLYVAAATLAALIPMDGSPAWLRLAIMLCGSFAISAVIVVLYWLGKRSVAAVDGGDGLIQAAWALFKRMLVEAGRMQTRMRRHRSATWWFWAASFCNVAALIGMVGVLLADLGADPGIAPVMLSASAAAVLGSVPISLNGIGLYEASLTWLLGTAGVPIADAIIVALMMRALVMAVSVIGCPSLFVLRRASAAPEEAISES